MEERFIYVGECLKKKSFFGMTSTLVLQVENLFNIFIEK